MKCNLMCCIHVLLLSLCQRFLQGRLAFRALFSREVLPQSFSPPHDLINKDNQMDNKDHLESKKCICNCDQAQQNLPFVQNNNEEGFLTMGLGQGKLKTRRTGFKPYKRCLVEAKESRGGMACNQVEETGPKRIRLEGGTSI
jgi:MYB-related transcription factor LHY